MSLRELQSALARTCFDAEVSSVALDPLHGPTDRWLVYRHMVRSRLEQMAAKALRRTRQTVGAEEFTAAFSVYLEEQPPRTRYIREVVSCFVAHATDRWRASAQVPAHTVDLARFEACRWELADRPECPAPACADFDFDAVPLLGSLHEVLALDYPVQRKLVAPAVVYPAERTWVLVHRRRGGTQAEVLSLNAVTAALLERWVAGHETVSESVRNVAQARQIEMSAAFIEGLCGVLADLLERGVLLGSRPPTPG